MNGSEHVVVGEDVSKAQVLHRSSEVANGSRITPKFVLGVRDAYIHGSSFPHVDSGAPKQLLLWRAYPFTSIESLDDHYVSTHRGSRLHRADDLW